MSREPWADTNLYAKIPNLREELGTFLVDVKSQIPDETMHLNNFKKTWFSSSKIFSAAANFLSIRSTSPNNPNNIQYSINSFATNPWFLGYMYSKRNILECISSHYSSIAQSLALNLQILSRPTAINYIFRTLSRVNLSFKFNLLRCTVIVIIAGGKPPPQCFWRWTEFLLLNFLCSDQFHVSSTHKSLH